MRAATLLLLGITLTLKNDGEVDDLVTALLIFSGGPGASKPGLCCSKPHAPAFAWESARPLTEPTKLKCNISRQRSCRPISSEAWNSKPKCNDGCDGPTGSCTASQVHAHCGRLNELPPLRRFRVMIFRTDIEWHALAASASDSSSALRGTGTGPKRSRNFSGGASIALSPGLTS